MNVWSEARSLSVRVIGMGCFMMVHLLFHHHLTPVNIKMD